MLAAIKAGAAYFGIVFAAGFVLGTIRVLLVVPHVGQTVAVLIETPIILGIGWIACRRCTSVFQISRRLHPRMLMAAVAFMLLMFAEALLAVVAFGQTLAGFVTSLGTTPGAIGFLAQVAFGLIPVFQGRLRV
jgi:hypothetical protein